MAQGAAQARDMAGRAGGHIAASRDIMLAVGVVILVAVLILPMPKWLLDASLSVSITFSVLILMTSLLIPKPVEFSSFPTILLLATLLRLALNLASTRLILQDGHTGTAAAGDVIQAFGNFVMGGDFIIGVIVFVILVVVNFVVITKGAGRIAEVSARFTLDAMPGKQMAIDADLSSGLIDEAEAKRRRKELEEESTFFGAMDGASKFVRGDAIAGVVITLINVIGGLLIGTLRHNLPIEQAANFYTVLTVGDGLVTQIPAIIVSIAAGILVSKSAAVGSADKAMFGQLGGYPKGLGITAMMAAGLAAFAPGLPFLPFAAIAIGLGLGAYFLGKRAKREDAARPAKGPDGKPMPAAPGAPAGEEPIAQTLQIDNIRLELGYGLLALINNSRGQRLTDQIKALRRQLAGEMGFVMPAVRIQDNLQLPANTYVIRLKEIDAGRGDLRPNMLLVMDPRGEEIGIAGEKTTEPTFGLPAVWIDENLREEALFRGYTVVDPPTVITTHLTEVVKDNMSELLTFAETQKLLDELDKEQQKLVADVIPGQISMGGLQRVLQNLLAERVSIRDLPAILEGVSEACGYTRNVMMITEHVRARLARQISSGHTGEQAYIPLITLSPQWEQTFHESLVGEGDDRQLSMPPSRLQEFINAVRETFDRHAMLGETPVLLTSPGIRPYVRSIIERFRPQTPVLSQNEIHPKAKIKTLGQV
ncbi:MAG: flagellar biosynthesis protein FlhA [Alphaproteobacteria bacterium]|nr:flagellar biosynthesis protein FlhA [Alphaproteobacteria bacterium]